MRRLHELNHSLLQVTKTVAAALLQLILHVTSCVPPHRQSASLNTTSSSSSSQVKNDARELEPGPQAFSRPSSDTSALSSSHPSTLVSPPHSRGKEKKKKKKKKKKMKTIAPKPRTITSSSSYSTRRRHTWHRMPAPDPPPPPPGPSTPPPPAAVCGLGVWASLNDQGLWQVLLPIYSTCMQQQVYQSFVFISALANFFFFHDSHQV